MFYSISVESAVAFVFVSLLSWGQIASALLQMFHRRVILFSHYFSSGNVAGKGTETRADCNQDMVRLLFVLTALNWQALFLNCS